MNQYLIRRTLLIVPTLFLISVIVFLSLRFIPGDVIDVMAAEMRFTQSGGVVDREMLERVLGSISPYMFSTDAG